MSKAKEGSNTAATRVVQEQRGTLPTFIVYLVDMRKRQR